MPIGVGAKLKLKAQVFHKSCAPNCLLDLELKVVPIGTETRDLNFCESCAFATY